MVCIDCECLLLIFNWIHFRHLYVLFLVIVLEKCLHPSLDAISRIADADLGLQLDSLRTKSV